MLPRIQSRTEQSDSGEVKGISTDQVTAKPTRKISDCRKIALKVKPSVAAKVRKNTVTTTKKYTAYCRMLFLGRFTNQWQSPLLLDTLLVCNDVCPFLSPLKRLLD